VIRRFTNSRPALIVAFVLLWTFHFSFGMFYHYHPEYLHAHDGELQAHSHSGHFHSLALEHLAGFLDSGETHHHSESLPGSDAETVQYDLNKSSLPEFQLAWDINLDTAPVAFTSAETKIFRSLLISSAPHRNLLYLQSFSERSPPLRV